LGEGWSDLEARQCTAALSLKQAQMLAQEAELRLHVCTVCGRENLYPIKSASGEWALEPHNVLVPRFDGEALSC
jgi:hypothetical protein